MENTYISKNVSQPTYSSTATTTRTGFNPRAKSARPGNTVLNKIEGLFKKKSVRTVAEVANYLKVDADLVPRQIRRLKENRGYKVSLIKKNNRSYYQVI